MSSAAEQLAANINWGAFSKADELKKRIWFTLGVLIVFRFGSYVPLPGINPDIMREIATQNAGGIMGILDMFSGGALGRMTIMALGLMPYISASIIVQLLTAISPHFEALKKEGSTGKKKLNQYTRYGTVLLATFQSYGLSVMLEGMQGMSGPAVAIPGLLFKFTTIVTIVGSTLFLMWLGEQISNRGIGNGTSMIIYGGIVANLPQAILSTLELGRTGALSVFIILGICVLCVAIIAFVVFMERAHRKVIIQYPKRQVGMSMTSGESTHMPIKLNVSGVIPPIFASSLLLMPSTVAGFMAGKDSSGWLQAIVSHLTHGSTVFIALFIGLIVFFSFFYTAIVFNPEETAENLKKNGGFIPGYRPGKMTADYFDYLTTRLTVLGAAYLSFICVLPEILMTQYSLPFYLGGTSLMIVVSVTMDTVAQIHSHLLAHQYEGLIKRGKLRGIRR